MSDITDAINPYGQLVRELAEEMNTRRALPPVAGSQLSDSIMAWSSAWILDGDLCRCRKCGRGIIISRMAEPIQHASDCPQSHLIAPWQDLRSRIPENSV